MPWPNRESDKKKGVVVMLTSTRSLDFWEIMRKNRGTYHWF